MAAGLDVLPGKNIEFLVFHPSFIKRNVSVIFMDKKELHSKTQAVVSPRGDKERAWKALFAARGALKGQAKYKTEEEWQKAKREAGEAFLRKLDQKFNLT
jgi:hypothetical protein